MAKLGVGIVGAGWVAGEHIRAFEADPHTQVLALCSRTEEGARAKAAECGVACEFFTDYAKMLDQDGIDIIAIATPPDCHEEEAVAAAEAGKHILIEKAMATTLEGARAVRDAVANAGVKTVVSFVLRWNPLIGIIRAQLADNAIGSVMLGEVDYFHGIGPWYKQYAWHVKKDVGVSSLLSAGCHAVDTLRCFMGGDIAEVFQYSTSTKGAEFAEYEYDPTSCTLCKFSDGRLGKVASSIDCVQPYVFNINLVGTHGTIKNNRLYSKKKFPGQTGWVEIPTVLPDSGEVSHRPFQLEVAHLVDCILHDKDSHCDVADSYRTHEVCFAADQSAERGAPVQLPLP
ncbi:MAG: Gfo/Idh/MocA family oxidoreductase [Candidatus Hydrogenedentes bacterium]|nr:Gfo/Idh/MocA family oxidoreductase [Candidatus Hydrogenedentota bacterium]